jgi:hypothetical protein
MLCISSLALTKKIKLYSSKICLRKIDIEKNIIIDRSQIF